MPQAERLAAGFPVEVAIFEPHRIKQREVGASAYANSDSVYSFTFAPDTTNDGVFCDAPGYREGSIAWGMTLDPVLRDDDPEYSASAIYIETTQEELARFIASLQNLYDENFGDRRVE